MKKLSIIFSGVSAALLVPATALAEWEPLLDATDFSGIRADLVTAAAGIVSVVLVVLGIGILIRVLQR